MKKNLLFFVFTSLFFFAGCSVEEAPAVSEKISNTLSEIKNSEKIEKPENSDSLLKKLVAQEQENFLEKNVEILLELDNSDNASADNMITVNVFLKNPDKKEIQSVQAWFLYPSKIWKGEKITLTSKKIFPIVAPHEQDFDAKNGIVKLGFSAEGNGVSTEEKILLAQVKFSSREENEISLSAQNPLFGFQLFETHTQVMTFTKNGLRDVLKK